MARTSFRQIQKDLRRYADPKKAEFLKRFFRTGKGEYGEGDRFLGIVVPDTRRVARLHRDSVLSEVIRLLHSPWHEDRLAALFILVERFQKGDLKTQKSVYQAYVSNLKYVNNWDLVDSSAHHIVGGYLLEKNRRPIYTWARSKDLWKRRVSMISTYRWIRQGDLKDAFQIAELLLKDEEDLIHKAVGWMLREAGKKDLKALERFLQKHGSTMPRTTLRYAIEKFPITKRKRYLKGKV